MEQGLTASSRIEALLQRVLEKVDGLERQVASQNSRLEDVQSELQVVRAEVEAVDAKVDVKMEAADARAKDRQDATDASLKDVVKFAGEERARRIKQEWQQIKFVSVIHVVASVGFVKEVLVCFSLNRSTWIDVRLWRVVINNVYKHKEQRFSYTRADGTRVYRDVNLEETRLLRQCRRGRESSVQRLLRMGANVHITNEDGDPALSVASGLGRTRLVSALVAAGADVSFGRAERADGVHRYGVGRTALMSAAVGNHPEAMTVLVQAGADVNQEDEHGETALMWAKKEAAKTLLALGADVNYASSESGMTALMHALNNPDKVKLFIEAGADVHLADNGGKTALFHVEDQEESVKLLLDAGADVNHADHEGETAIFGAAYFGQLEVLKVLFDAGADVDHADNEGRTALFEPALCYEENGEIDDDDIETVKLFIAARVDVNHIANDGSTVLSRHTAALQTATEYLQNADEEEPYLEALEGYVARLTKIVALINERIAQLADLAKQAAAQASAAAISSGESAVKDKGKGGGGSGKCKR